jgi:hypothetical protein
MVHLKYVPHVPQCVVRIMLLLDQTFIHNCGLDIPIVEWTQLGYPNCGVDTIVEWTALLLDPQLWSGQPSTSHPIPFYPS